jgi:hypothetical protein
VIVGTVGAAVPEEVLAAAAADVIAVTGAPGAPTTLADRYVEPLVGERARSQLQRVLDGTYAELDLLVFSREEDAAIRLFYTLRELRRLEPERRLPPVHLVDLQHAGTPATSRWNVRRVRELCQVVGAREEALPGAIRACNARRSADGGATQGPRIYITGSDHRETRLRELVEARDGVVVEPLPVLAEEDDRPIEAIVRRYEHPLLARARASSAQRAVATADDAAAVGADLVIAFYREGDDGLRWEFPEVRAELEARGIPVLLRDRQPYDLRDLELDV